MNNDNISNIWKSKCCLYQVLYSTYITNQKSRSCGLLLKDLNNKQKVEKTWKEKLNWLEHSEPRINAEACADGVGCRKFVRWPSQMLLCPH